jgi:hypothetical protein
MRDIDAGLSRMHRDGELGWSLSESVLRIILEQRSRTSTAAFSAAELVRK